MTLRVHPLSRAVDVLVFALAVFVMLTFLSCFAPVYSQVANPPPTGYRYDFLTASNLVLNVTTNGAVISVQVDGTGGGGGLSNPLTIPLDCGGFSVTNSHEFALSSTGGGTLFSLDTQNFGGPLWLFMAFDNNNGEGPMFAVVNQIPGVSNTYSLCIKPNNIVCVGTYSEDGTPTVLQAPSLSVNQGTVILQNLPGYDPAVAGQLWNDGGTLKVSAGG